MITWGINIFDLKRKFQMLKNRFKISENFSDFCVTLIYISTEFWRKGVFLGHADIAEIKEINS